jgi:putative transposase
MNKAIKYRAYPTTEQCVLFAKTFGCCRKVYNLMLSDKIDSYKATGKFAPVTPAKYKKDYPYLKEVDSLALANKQMDLQAAFRNCFSKSRKKKTGSQNSSQPNIAAGLIPPTIRRGLLLSLAMVSNFQKSALSKP